LAIQFTANFQLPYPQLTDTADVPRDVAALAAATDAALLTVRDRVPPGSVMIWLVPAAPAGWYILQGQNDIDAATNPGLTALFGPAVAGKITLPDMRDLFPAGAGANIGAVAALGGLAAVTLTDQQSGMRAHNHSGLTGARDRNQVHGHTGSTGSVAQSSGGELLAGYLSQTFNGATGVKFDSASIATTGNDAPDHFHTVPNQAAQNAAQSHENRPPYRAVNFIIKAG
jgi:microcystin-dependent protein